MGLTKTVSCSRGMMQRLIEILLFSLHNHYSWRGCECPVDFVGTMCEFQKRDDEPYICNMQCANGFCRHGAKDTSWLEEFDFGTRHRHLTQRFDQEFEHCQCPPGWVGLHCDFKVNVCPGQTHVCLNGGICVFDETTDFDYKCDCSHAHDDGQKYAGDYCQYEATSYCTFDGKQPQGDAFCTNDGICRDFVAHDDTHPGCFCLEGFEGPHCEQVVPPPVRSSSEGKSGDQDWIWLVIVVLSFLGIILIIIMWIMDRRRRLHRMFKANATDGPYGIYPEKDLDMVPYKDVPSLENSLDEDVFEDEISRDKVDNRSPVFEPSDGLFMDSDSHSKGSSRTSSLYSKGSSKRSKGSSKRSNNSSTHTPDTYSLTVQEKDYFKDLEMAGLAPLGGARLVSEIPPTVNDDQFNPSEYANCDYSLDSSTMRNMQLVPVDSSEYQDTYGLGTFNEEKASNDDIKIQQKSSADSGFSSGVDSMSTMESEITGIGEDETKRRAKSRKKYIQGKHSKVPGAESAESSLEGENIVLSEDYALERHISGISHDKDPVVLTGVSQEGSNFVLMSQASALAGTVLDDSDSSHVSDTSAYMSEQGLTGVQVLREPSEHGSIKSLRSDSKRSLSSKGVRFDEKSQASKGSKSSSGSTRASVRSDNRRSTRGDKALSKGANDSNKTVKDDDARSEKSSGGKHSSSSASPAPEVKIRSSHEDNDGSVKSTSARSGRSSNAVVPDYDDSLHESKRKPSNVSSGDSKKSSSSRKSRGSNADQKKSDKPSQKSVDDEGDSVGNSTVSSGLGFWVFGG